MRRFLDDTHSEKATASPAVESDHRRIETRVVIVSTAIGWLQEHHQRLGLKAIGKIVRTRETASKINTETAHYLLSAEMPPERFGDVAKAHWAVEKSLHWTPDVTMNEGQSRSRLDNGPNNLAALRHMALNILNSQKSKISTHRATCKIAAAHGIFRPDGDEMRRPRSESGMVFLQ